MPNPVSCFIWISMKMKSFEIFGKCDICFNGIIFSPIHKWCKSIIFIICNSKIKPFKNWKNKILILFINNIFIRDIFNPNFILS